MPSLGALITARRKALSLTYDGLVERAGNALSRQRWQQLGTDTRVNEFPEPKTLQLIADTIDVSVDRVILATAVTLGVDIPDHRSTFATLLPPNADQLTDEQRDAVLAVIRAMRPSQSRPAQPPPVTPHAVPEPAPPPNPPLLVAARQTPSGHRKGRTHQGDAGGEENQDER